MGHRSGATDPELPAIKQGDTVLSYGDLDAASARLATVLADHGVRPGRHPMPAPLLYGPLCSTAPLPLGSVLYASFASDTHFATWVSLVELTCT